MRFELMKRKILFLHYLLKQDKNSLILKATRDNPANNDFGKTCQNYLDKLNIQQHLSKISHIKYDELCIQKYLLDGNRNREVAKLIYKARLITLGIRTLVV